MRYNRGSRNSPITAASVPSGEIATPVGGVLSEIVRSAVAPAKSQIVTFRSELPETRIVLSAESAIALMREFSGPTGNDRSSVPSVGFHTLMVARLRVRLLIRRLVTPPETRCAL